MPIKKHLDRSGGKSHSHSPPGLLSESLAVELYKINNAIITDTLWLVVLRARRNLSSSQRSVSDVLVAGSPARRYKSYC